MIKPQKTHAAPLASIARAGLVFSIVLLLVAGRAAPPAGAVRDYPFEPKLDISTDTLAAGTHPNLTIAVPRPKDFCWDVVDDDGVSLNCVNTPNPDDLRTYEQQDLKRITLTLPAGLAADVNAVPQASETDCTSVPRAEDNYTFYCPDWSRIGSVSGAWDQCAPDDPRRSPYMACGWSDAYDYLTRAPLVGDIYLATPRPGEQAHLIALVGITYPRIGPMPHGSRVDISVTVDRRGRITATADNMPDVQRLWPFISSLPAQPFDIRMTLFGALGSESGHPLVSNATSCKAKQAVGEAQSYATNAAYDRSQEGIVQGSGDGKIVPLSDDYYVQGCNSVPYEPTFEMTLDPATPGGNPAITSTITQASGEQTTGSVSLVFPSSFKVNVKNTNAQCSDDQWAANACPAESAIGTASAESPLLPVASGPVSGSVYLGQTDLGAGDITLMMRLANDFLPNGIDLTGQTHINADGSLEADFGDVPELPISKFTMALHGGPEKGLLANPKSCGPQTVDATFASHQGKQVARSPQLQISCNEASLAVDMSTRRPRSHPTVTMQVAASGMKELSLRLPGQLKVAEALAAGTRYGSLSFVGSAGTTEAKLVALRNALTKRRTTLSATSGGAQLAGLTFKHKKANKITLARIPEGTNSVTLELEGKTGDLLRLPSSCRSRAGSKRHSKSKGKRKALRFSATVTNVEGRTMRPSYTTRMLCRSRKKTGTKK